MEENKNNIIELIKKLGIIIEEVEENDTIAYTFFDEKRKKFVIRIKKQFLNNEKIILHEFLHIWRGDMFKKVDDHFLFNVACDFIINSIIGLKYPFVDEKYLKQNFGCSCEYLKKWREEGAFGLYEHLKEHIKNFNDNNNIKSDPFCYKEISENAREEAEREWRKIREKYIEDFFREKGIEEIDEKIEEEMKKLREKGSIPKKQKGDEKGDFIKIYVKAKSNIVLLKLLKAIEGEDGEILTLKRLPRRFIKFPRNIIILGREIEYPSITCLFIIDVSGSMNNYYEDILESIKFFEQNLKIKADKIFFSDTALLNKYYYYSGGGTLFKPVLDLLKKLNKKYDYVFVFSDYQMFDLTLDNIKKLLKKYAKKIILFNEKLEKI